MRISRRTLQIGLGLLWLLDGALQLQPFMFTKTFGRTVIAPGGADQPGIVSHPIRLAAQLVIAHPVITNCVFAVIQLALGIGLPGAGPPDGRWSRRSAGPSPCRGSGREWVA
jgi:hypothetical protein